MHTDLICYAKDRHKGMCLTEPKMFHVDYILGNVGSMLNVLFII